MAKVHQSHAIGTTFMKQARCGPTKESVNHGNLTIFDFSYGLGENRLYSRLRVGDVQGSCAQSESALRLRDSLGRGEVLISTCVHMAQALCVLTIAL